jgi:hypothetical protein
MLVLTEAAAEVVKSVTNPADPRRDGPADRILRTGTGRSRRATIIQPWLVPLRNDQVTRQPEHGGPSCRLSPGDKVLDVRPR